MKTFFRPEMTAQNQSFSPSAGKPGKFINYLKFHKLPLDIEADFAPATREDFSLAHDRLMVDEILDLRQNNGFGNKSVDVARSLPYTSGSFVAAAEYAVRHQTNTFSPTSGFHHANYERPGGYCTFNGLLVAALKLKQSGLVKKVGILDIDNHYGDGSEDIIRRLHIDWIQHYTFGAHHIDQKNAESWLKVLPDIVRGFKDCDVIFYQAGGDVHINDPLGGALTTDQMRLRDEIVFSVCAELKIPSAFNLAGGYQDPLAKVLTLHKTTYEIALKYTDKEKI